MNYRQITREIAELESPNRQLTQADKTRWRELTQQLSNELLRPLQTALDTGDTDVLPELLTFLEQAQPCHYGCLAIRKLLRKLKTVALDHQQITHIQTVALAQLADARWNSARHLCRAALVEMRRAMIPFATAKFVSELQHLSDHSDAAISAEAHRMLAVILHHRPDLNHKQHQM